MSFHEKRHASQTGELYGPMSGEKSWKSMRWRQQARHFTRNEDYITVKREGKPKPKGSIVNADGNKSRQNGGDQKKGSRSRRGQPIFDHRAYVKEMRGLYAEKDHVARSVHDYISLQKVIHCWLTVYSFVGTSQNFLFPIALAFYLCQAHDENLLLKLINAGADLDMLNSKGLAPIHVATQMRYPEGVAILLAAGAKIDTHVGRGSYDRGSPYYVDIRYLNIQAHAYTDFLSLRYAGKRALDIAMGQDISGNRENKQVIQLLRKRECPLTFPSALRYDDAVKARSQLERLFEESSPTLQVSTICISYTAHQHAIY